MQATKPIPAATADSIHNHAVFARIPVAVALAAVRTYAVAKAVQSLTECLPATAEEGGAMTSFDTMVKRWRDQQRILAAKSNIRCVCCSSGDVCWYSAPAECLGYEGEPLCDDCADEVWCEDEGAS